MSIGTPWWPSRVPIRRRRRDEERSFATTAKGLAELAASLLEAGVTTVAMEATGVYWRAPYYSLEGLFDELWLCNAPHVKNGRGERATSPTPSGWPTWPRMGWCGHLRPAPEIRAVREHPLPEDPGGRPGQGNPTPGEDPPRRRHQDHLGGIWGLEQVLEGDHRGDDRQERDPKVLAQMAKGSALQDPPARRGPPRSLRGPPRHRLSPDHRPHRLPRRSIAALTEEIATRLVLLRPSHDRDLGARGSRERPPR